MASVSFDRLLEKSRKTAQEKLNTVAPSKSTQDDASNQAMLAAKARAEAKLQEMKARQAALERAAMEKSEARQKAQAIELHNSAVPSKAVAAPKDKSQAASREQKRRKSLAALFDDDDDSTSRLTAQSVSRRSSPAPVRKSKSAPPPSKRIPPGQLSGKAKLTANLKPGDFIVLNKEKRDLRTIEEIERDMKLRRLETESIVPRSTSDFFATKAPVLRGSSASSSESAQSIATSASTASSAPSLARSAATDLSSASSSKRKLDEPASEPSSKRAKFDCDTSSKLTKPKSTIIVEPKKARFQSPIVEPKKARSQSPLVKPAKPTAKPKPQASSLRYDDFPPRLNQPRDLMELVGRKYTFVDEDDDSSSDMEASAADVWMEERRAARLSAKEDREEEAREKQRRLNKAKAQGRA